MATVHSNDIETERGTSSRTARLIQSVGAIFTTGFALWFLFGIPAYLLFGVFFA